MNAILAFVTSIGFIAVVIYTSYAFIGSLLGEPVFCKQYKTFKEEQEKYITWYEYETVGNHYSICHRKRIIEFPTITFEQFKDFYYLNPSSWELNDVYVTKNNDKNLSFTFEYSEWKKYKKFKKEIDRRKEIMRRLEQEAELKRQQDKTTIKILEEVQKDIDNIRAESMKNFKEAKELIIKACEGMKGDTNNDIR